MQHPLAFSSTQEEAENPPVTTGLPFNKGNKPPTHSSLNVDGACKGNPGDCGGGGCIRDSKGNIQMAFSYFYGDGTSMLAEIRALCDGLKLAASTGYQLSAVYSDSQSLVNSLNDGKMISWRSYRWWREAHMLLTQQHIHFSHVFREANQLADSLANFASPVDRLNQIDIKIS
ncbi:hypothetical protein Taro_031706 [Colocasia esculenta]|uniref:RNase H type-1 domain-containing protein n=1 Tax=Colocasia esculenta TaxID=4460 RepID=A0A843VQQ6_COLES|nr:hypothetical protein [Colocasia esculenta]